VTRPVGVMTDVLPSRDDRELFQRAKQLGFAGVEVILPAGLESLRAAQSETGLRVPSLVLGEHSDRGGVADLDPAVAATAVEDVRRAAGWARALGADALLVPFFGRAELHDAADVARAAAALRPLCDSSVQILFEGTLPAEAIRDLASHVDSPQFGCYFDLANVVTRGMDTATELRALGDLVRRVHVKDARAKVNDCAPGLGFVDFVESSRALEEIGYDGWIVLETPPGPPELVARDLSFVRSVIPGLEPAVEWPRIGVFARERDEWDAVLSLGVDVVQLGEDLLDLERVEALGAAGIGVAAIAGSSTASSWRRNSGRASSRRSPARAVARASGPTRRRTPRRRRGSCSRSRSHSWSLPPSGPARSSRWKAWCATSCARTARSPASSTASRRGTSKSCSTRTTTSRVTCCRCSRASPLRSSTASSIASCSRTARTSGRAAPRRGTFASCASADPTCR
jgi:sugar phosphate isomerase/epimerase